MDQALIQSEFIKRKYLCDAIKIYIGYNFKTAPRSKLRRGRVQKQISDALGIRINNIFCMLVNDCMEEKGFKRGEIHGDYVYKNVEIINANNE